MSHERRAFGEWLDSWIDDGGIVGQAAQDDLEDAFAAGYKAGFGPHEWVTSEVPMLGIKGGDPAPAPASIRLCSVCGPQCRGQWLS